MPPSVSVLMRDSLVIMDTVMPLSHFRPALCSAQPTQIQYLHFELIPNDKGKKKYFEVVKGIQGMNITVDQWS